MKALWLVVAACAHPTVIAPPIPSAPVNDDDRLSRITAELADDILIGYERDEPPEVESGMVQPSVGAARIGVGPGDVLIGDELRRAPSRWPLDVDPTIRTDAKSKRLEIHISADQTAAWTSDELSWRIPMCNRTAVIPLRETALYAHDGDRWVPVFTHTSFAHPLVPTAGGAHIKSTGGGDLTDELSRVLQTGVLRATDRVKATIASGPESLVMGPTIEAESRGLDAQTAALVPALLRSEDRRVGTIGRIPARATVAYWVGNVVADLPATRIAPAGKARLRGTFVFEQRRVDEGKGPRCGLEHAVCHWVLVQAHVSQPIDDNELALDVFGTALTSPKPLAWTCDDGSTTTQPSARQSGPGATSQP